MDTLTFGTDGWRALVGETFTHANLARAAQAYAEHLLDRGGGLVLVGHDTRFGGARFARVAAATLQANGLAVAIHEGPLPTPVLSFAVRELGAAGGVMLTASHNPAEYQGFKLKDAYGGTALDATYRDVGSRVAAQGPAAVRAAALETSFEYFDVREAYYRQLTRVLDLPLWSAASGRLLHDAMGGAAGGWLSGFVRWAGFPLEVEELRAEPDPTFDGVNPEPIPSNLGRTMRLLQQRDDLRFAVCTDGDGDRVAAVLPGGDYFNPHQVFAVLLDLLDLRGGPGALVKTFTISRLIDRLAAARGRSLIETPVGFKHLVEYLRTGEALLAGEESGGFGLSAHLPERDGILNGLLLMEAELRGGQPLAERFAALEAEAGWRHAYDRLDLRLSGDEVPRRLKEALADDPTEFAGRRVTTVERLDGVKLNLGEDSWLLFRPSGTEPVLRLYAEGPDGAAVANMLAAAQAFVTAL